MTHKSIKSRTAMTAIAAVIALSSTPVLAQDASVPDPVADTAAETPVTVAPDPLAPDPAATTTQAPETADTSEAAPAARRSASTTRSSRNRAAAPARAAPLAPVAAPAGEVLAEPAVPVLAEVAPPIAEPAAPVAEPVPVEQTDMVEEYAPIAGAAGLGLLALAVAGLVIRRRRRRLQREEFEARQLALAHVEAEPEPAIVEPEPVFTRAPAPMHDPVHPAAAATALPAGFDVSRFGRHVQAAYRGPTPDNPSLSLKNRLRRASFFDQQERRATAEAGTTAKPTAPAWASRKPNEAEFMFRPAAKKTGMKPAFQK